MPYPVEFTGDGMLMQPIGEDGVAAPGLVNARLGPEDLATAYAQLSEDLVALPVAGLVHADLSPYNVLWWRGRPGSSTSRRPSTSCSTPTASTCCTTTW